MRIPQPYCTGLPRARCSNTRSRRSSILEIKLGSSGGSVEKENIESALLEHRRFPPPDSFVARARLRPQEVEAMRRKAEADHVGYWADLARKSLYWHKPFTVTLDDSKAPNYRWFPDGQLNVSWNCLDVHLAARGEKPAIIFEDEAGGVRRLSYRQLHTEVCRLANGLKELGV